MEEQLAKCRFNASMVCLFHFKGAPASAPWVISDEVVKIDVGQCCGHPQYRTASSAFPGVALQPVNFGFACSLSRHFALHEVGRARNRSPQFGLSHGRHFLPSPAKAVRRSR
jgi:hypothetical protein